MILQLKAESMHMMASCTPKMKFIQKMTPINTLMMSICIEDGRGFFTMISFLLQGCMNMVEGNRLSRVDGGAVYNYQGDTLWWRC